MISNALSITRFASHPADDWHGELAPGKRIPCWGDNANNEKNGHKQGKASAVHA
jgi:hypothetical protein